MKRLQAWITGGLLTASVVAVPLALANDDDHGNAGANGRYNGAQSVHYESAPATVSRGTYENGVYYVDVNGERMAWPEASVMISEPGGMFVSRNGQLYNVQDDPSYDLSGAGKSIILVDDGSIFQSNSWNHSIAFARAGGSPKEVVTLPAQYRQHWLAVAAGDRPVRNLTAVPMAPKGATMTFVPVTFARDRARMDEQRERPATYSKSTKAKRTSAVKRTAARKSHHKKSSATMASRNGYRSNGHRAYATRTNGYRTNGYRANGYRANGYRANGYRANGSTAYTADTSNRTRVGTTFEAQPEPTRNLYQAGSSWYQFDGDSWSRSDSWRGPFVSISSGMVPREVKESQKEPFKD